MICVVVVRACTEHTPIYCCSVVRIRWLWRYSFASRLLFRFMCVPHLYRCNVFHSVCMACPFRSLNGFLQQSLFSRIAMLCRCDGNIFFALAFSIHFSLYISLQAFIFCPFNVSFSSSFPCSLSHSYRRSASHILIAVHNIAYATHTKFMCLFI